MKKHYVDFFSPGSFVSEQTTRELLGPDVGSVVVAVNLARTIKERYDARPFGFQFVERERGPDDFGSYEVFRSGMYFLGGTVLTLGDVIARNDPKDKILISNMRVNNIARIVENTNSWTSVHALTSKDVVLDMNQYGGPL